MAIRRLAEIGLKAPKGNEAMAKVIEFPDVKGDRTAFDAKMQLIGRCQMELAAAMKRMREDGADTGQIIRILRHAITELELDDPA